MDLCTLVSWPDDDDWHLRLWFKDKAVDLCTPRNLLEKFVSERLFLENNCSQAKEERSFVRWAKYTSNLFWMHEEIESENSAAFLKTRFLFTYKSKRLQNDFIANQRTGFVPERVLRQIGNNTKSNWDLWRRFVFTDTLDWTYLLLERYISFHREHCSGLIWKFESVDFQKQ